MVAAVTNVRSLCGGTGPRAVPYLTVPVRCWTSALEVRALSHAGGGAAWPHGAPRSCAQKPKGKGLAVGRAALGRVRAPGQSPQAGTVPQGAVVCSGRGSGWLPGHRFAAHLADLAKPPSLPTCFQVERVPYRAA